jgi:hypothetical protein
VTRRAALAGAALAAALALLYALDPASAGFVLCPVRAFSGLACPGCGSLRGVHDLLHGDWRAALGHNAILPMTLPLLAWLAGCWIAGRRPRVPQGLAVALLVAALVFAVARNT